MVICSHMFRSECRRSDKTSIQPHGRSSRDLTSLASAAHQVRKFSQKEIKWHFADINSVWRPVQFPIEDYPLAVADGSTVNPDDLIAADYVRTTYQGENLLPLYNKNCRWHYLSDQMPDDILLFKSYDSREQSKAKCK